MAEVDNSPLVDVAPTNIAHLDVALNSLQTALRALGWTPQQQERLNQKRGYSPQSEPVDEDARPPSAPFTTGLYAPGEDGPTDVEGAKTSLIRAVASIIQVREDLSGLSKEVAHVDEKGSNQTEDPCSPRSLPSEPLPAERPHEKSTRWYDPIRTAVVVEGEDQKSGTERDVAQWLNENFAEVQKRDANTGFDVRLHRSSSILGANMLASRRSLDDRSASGGDSPRNASATSVTATDSPRGESLTQEQDSEDTHSASRSIPHGLTLTDSQSPQQPHSRVNYQRSHNRTFRAYCSTRVLNKRLRQVDVPNLPNVTDPDFDIFEMYNLYGDDVFAIVCANVLLRYNFVSSLGINLRNLMNFIRALQNHYVATNPYHNGIHAADVCQTTNVYLNGGDVKEFFSDVELLAVLFAAMVHDVGHPGINNGFLSKIRHPLAVVYNDTSVLESAHIALGFILLERPECDIFADSKVWSEATDTDFRKMVIDIVIGTDMNHHAALMQSVSSILEDGRIDDDEVAKLFKAIVHAADLSNPMKPFHIYKNWMERVQAESWRQGDEERKRGMEISVMCDRNKPAVFAMQVGFIQHIVKPFMRELGPVLPPVWLQRLESNLDFVKTQAAVAEVESIERIASLSVPQWVDVPVKGPSYFSVLTRFFDDFREMSQVGFQNERRLSVSAKEPCERRTMLETHQLELVADAERWHQLFAQYRPGLGRTGSFGSSTASPTAAGGDSTTDDATADEEYFQRFCADWVKTVLEQQRRHRVADDRAHTGRQPSFVPYLPPELTDLLLDSAEDHQLQRRSGRRSSSSLQITIAGPGETPLADATFAVTPATPTGDRRADEAVAIDVIAANPRLAISVVESLVLLTAPTPKNRSAKVVAVAEPPSAQGPRGAMIRFVGSLTKILVTSFQAQLRRTHRSAPQTNSRRSSAAPVIPVPAAAATAAAPSVVELRAGGSDVDKVWDKAPSGSSSAVPQALQPAAGSLSAVAVRNVVEHQSDTSPSPAALMGSVTLTRQGHSGQAVNTKQFSLLQQQHASFAGVLGESLAKVDPTILAAVQAESDDEDEQYPAPEGTVSPVLPALQGSGSGTLNLAETARELAAGASAQQANPLEAVLTRVLNNAPSARSLAGTIDLDGSVTNAVAHIATLSKCDSRTASPTGVPHVDSAASTARASPTTAGVPQETPAAPETPPADAELSTVSLGADYSRHRFMSSVSAYVANARRLDMKRLQSAWGHRVQRVVAISRAQTAAPGDTGGPMSDVEVRRTAATPDLTTAVAPL